MIIIRSIGARLLCLAVLAATTLASSAPASHAQSGPMVIAIVDLNVISRDSKAAVGARAALEKQSKAFQSELTKQETALQQEGQQLEQQRATMSPDDFRKKSDAFQQKVNSARQTAAARRQQLQQMEAGAMNQVQAGVAATVTEVAQARGISLVLVKGAVLYSLPAFDITKEVLQKLDARLPSVSLSTGQ
jgi:outer membrane protein